MGCCDDVRRVAYFYIDGTLGASKAEYVTSHLSECRDCDSRFRLHRSIRNFICKRLSGAPAPESLRSRILSLCRSAQPQA